MEQSAGHLLSNAKIVQTKGTAKKKRAFSLLLLSAAYPSCRKAKSANERNSKEKACFLLFRPTPLVSSQSMTKIAKA